MSKNPLRPDETKNTVYDIDYMSLKKSGYDLLLFDLDNTLLPQDDMEVTKEVKELFERLKKDGFDCALVSNNGRERIEPVAGILGLDFIAKAAKPLPFATKKAVNGRKKAVFIGDQLSDIMAGNLSGLYTFWVKPISVNEHFGTKLKRGFERIVIKLLNISW